MKPTASVPRASKKSAATQTLKLSNISTKPASPTTSMTPGQTPTSRVIKSANKAAQGPAKTKLSTVVAMLRDKRGASIDQLVKATGWQKHSVRGAISGALKKRLGLNVVTETTDGGRIYRIAK